MNRNSTNTSSNFVVGSALIRNSRIVGFTSLVVAVMLLIGAAPVWAGDGKIYPGSMCVRYAGTSTPTYNNSAIGNPSGNSWLYLDCPAIHDTIGRSIKKGWVRMIDQHYNSNIRCNLNSILRNGSVFWGWWTPNKSSAGSGVNPQHITYGGIGANTLAHYYYSCRIPPRYSGNTSYITSYYVEER
jgi:hypothetical protein